MGLNFPRETIAYQRQRLADFLGPQTRVSRRQYYNEMKQSKVVVSPFGWGEINNRDFEAFIYGNLLVKPSVEHLETYPKFFEEGKTYLPYKWDLSDMKEVITEAIENYPRYKDIAIEAQSRYTCETISRQGRENFVSHFSKILTTA